LPPINPHYKLKKRTATKTNFVLFYHAFIGVHRCSSVVQKKILPFHLYHSVANQADLQFHRKNF